MSSLFFEERYQARRSYRKSCDRCHASKLKCASLDPADPFSECVRCNKARLPCSYSPRCAKPAILQRSDAFGDRPEDHNSDVIFATIAPTVLYGRSPIHATGSDATLQHHAKPSVSSTSASSTDLESGLSTGSDGSSPYGLSKSPSKSNLPATASSDVSQALSFTDNYQSSLDVLDHWLEWEPSPSDLAIASVSCFEPERDPFAELFAGMNDQAAMIQDVGSPGICLQAQPATNTGVLSSLTDEARLLEHTSRLSRLYAGLRDGTWGQAPRTVDDLSKYPIGQLLREIEDFWATIASIQRHDAEQEAVANDPGSTVPASQSTSMLLLLAHCYVLMVSIAARQFSDLCSFTRAHKISQWPSCSRHIPWRNSTSFLGSVEPLMDTPLGKVYAAAKSCAELLVSIEVMLDVPAEWSIDGGVGPVSTSTLPPSTVERPNSASTLFAAPQPRYTSLTSSVLDVLMRHESCGQSGRTPISILRTCVQELRHAVKEELGL